MQASHFFIVGAQRSGTSYLYQLCAEHPQIEMAQPAKPEPKFFMTDSLFKLGLDYYEHRYFTQNKRAQVLGEKSTSYIETEIAAKQIFEYFPTAKIVFILRNPVERAISNYWFSVRNGFETLPIDQAFSREEERLRDYDSSKVSVSPYAYLARGRYIEYIEMYEKYFNSSQIHVLVYEQLIDSVQHLQDLYSFLKVDAKFTPKSINTMINSNDEKPLKKLDSSLESHLQKYFEETNARLSKKIDKSLNKWWW